MSESLTDAFAEKFGGLPEFVVRAPGRVNLIGEHTDYNDGFVLPMAIDLAVTIAGSRREDMQVSVYAESFDQSSQFSLTKIESSIEESWSNYLRGVAAQLIKANIKLSGANLYIRGNVPVASGLSSSAALEVASCLALENVSGINIGPVERAKVSQRAEREFVGVNCGIMDQYISSNGKEGCALLLDTRSMEFELIEMPKNIVVLVGDTHKQRGLADSEYNVRRSQCEEAVKILKTRLPYVKALRDVTEDDLFRHEELLSATVFSRAMHVVSENARVLAGAAAMKSGDIRKFGGLMNRSHESLRDDYAVSCKELDVMVSAIRRAPGVYGSRMTGAGFGGCTVSLVAPEAVLGIVGYAASEYETATGITPTFYAFTAASGAGKLSLEDAYDGDI